MTEHNTDDATDESDDELGDFEDGFDEDVDDAGDGEDVDENDGAPDPGPVDPLADDFKLGDPCIDMATGRTVIVADVPEKTVAEWSGDNGYELTENYANERTRATPNDPVVEAAYASSIQSEPNGPRGSDSGGYTFPSSRLARVTIESIDGIDRVYDMVARDVLERLMVAGDAYDGGDHCPSPRELAISAGFEPELVDTARELASVDELSAPTEGDDGE